MQLCTADTLDLPRNEPSGGGGDVLGDADDVLLSGCWRTSCRRPSAVIRRDRTDCAGGTGPRRPAAHRHVRPTIRPGA